MALRNLVSVYLCPVVAGVSYFYFSSRGFSLWISILATSVLTYLPTYIDTLRLGKYGGLPWLAFQKWSFFKRVIKYLDGKITLEEPLNHEQLYIFCCFPHGPLSTNHMLTMTDCCGMLTEHYKGERRDLAASVLHYIPLVKELVLWSGCVDAGAFTANYNLKKGRSLLIYVGGEKEQLMSENGKHKIYLKHRKGFVKLALQYGAHLVPMYAFGENEVFSTSQMFMGFRLWLQSTFSIGMPLIYGLPHRIKLHLEMGKPLEVAKVPKEEITQAQIDTLHAQFLQQMERLFDRTKVKLPEHKDAKLVIM